MNEAGRPAHEPLIITGEQFRRDILGWGKNSFYALVKSGQVAHLRAEHLCTAHRTYYVKAKAEAWATQTPTVRLRGLRQTNR